MDGLKKEILGGNMFGRVPDAIAGKCGREVHSDK